MRELNLWLREQVADWVEAGPALWIRGPRAKWKCRGPLFKITKKLRQWLLSIKPGGESFWVRGPVWLHCHPGPPESLACLRKKPWQCVSVERIWIQKLTLRMALERVLIKGRLSSWQVPGFQLDPYHAGEQEWGRQTEPEGGFAD